MSVISDIMLVCGGVVVVVVAYVAQRLFSTYLYYQRQKGLFSHMKSLEGIGRVPMLHFFDQRLGNALKCMDSRDEKGALVPPPNTLHLGAYLDGTHLIATGDPEALKQLLVEEKFPKHPLGYGILDIMLGNGLVTSTGALWHRQRKLITPSFHFTQLKLMHSAMMAEGAKMVARLKAQPLSPKDFGGREPVNAAEFFSSVTMAVIVQTSFGGLLEPVVVAGHWRRLNKAFNLYALTRMALGRTVNDLIPFPANKIVYGEIKALKALIRDAISKKRQMLADSEAQGSPVTARDLLTSLLQARDEDGNGMDEELVIDECLTFLFAGHDTTSNLLSWAMYVLAQRPDEQKKLQEEVDSVLGGQTPTMVDLKQLPYSKCVLQEVLRLHGPAPFLERIAPVDSVLSFSDGSVETIPAGTAIWLMFNKAMTDPRFWGDDSEEFRPSRFDKSRAKEEVKRHPFSFTPFSAGARNCIGQKFAQNEALSFLAMLMQNFTVHADPAQDVRMVFEGTSTPQGFHCSFSPRD